MPSVAAEKIASCLARLAGEHGTPNSFPVQEIASATGLTPMKVGAVLSRENVAVDECLARRGLSFTGYGKRDGVSHADVGERSSPPVGDESTDDVVEQLLTALKEARGAVERFATEEARANKVRVMGAVWPWRDKLAKIDAAIRAASGKGSR